MVTEDIKTILESLLYASGGAQPLGGVDFSRLPAGPESEALRGFAARLLEGAAERPDAQAGAQFEVPPDVRPGASEGRTPLSGFLAKSADAVREELDRLADENPEFRRAVERGAELLRSGEVREWGTAARDALWPVFFPEGAAVEGREEDAVSELRRRRVVTLERLSETPIEDPATEILFTSNVLLTVPHSPEELEGLPLDEELKTGVRAALGEKQIYYYDHPIHIGTPLDKNEAIYGLRGLNEAVAYEKEHTRAHPGSRATVVLSLSVTHEALHEVGRDYLEAEIAREGGFEHLRVYLFTELECMRIVEEVLTPFLPSESVDELLGVFGVDGEYGRHYSFLKAIAAFWRVFVDPHIRGTFKIDLDQVFPQAELELETGRSAFGHFRTPLWGALGRDADGNPVELGMIAGALVNEKDIGHGVFTPDVPYPEEIPEGEAAVFFNKLPMAVSTRGEMMTRYEAEPADSGTPRLDGRNACTQRVHVTGGTNGILVEHLRRHRPFTPSFVGRAEDQAYLMSVLYEPQESGAMLRYVHEPGLIMRHDKEAFAGESIAAAEDGRFVGDLVRTFVFTRYADALPWDTPRTKAHLDPFTGCFITRRCYTVIVLRLVLHAARRLYTSGAERARAVLELAERKLEPLFEADRHGNPLGDAFRRERGAWHSYYDALEAAEGAVQTKDATAQSARRAAGSIVSGARIA